MFLWSQNCALTDNLFAVIPSHTVLTSYRFSQCCALGLFFQGLWCWFSEKTSDFQNKNLMTKTFFTRHQVTDIIPYYRFPRRVIHGKYILPVLLLSHFFKIPINAVRTWNKLFLQNVRSAICSHYTVLLSKEEKGFASVKKALCYTAPSFLASYLMFQWVNSASQIYIQV